MLPGVADDKPVVIVSNNVRNRNLGTVLAVRVTTAPEPSVPSLVRVPAGEALVGTGVCGDIVRLGKASLRRTAGALSGRTMRQSDLGLRAALALDGPPR